MLKRLKVQNFMCIEDFDEELSPGVNVFWGFSGTGKSSVAIRAPMLLSLNRPAGISFLYDPRITGNEKWKQGPAQVLVETGDGRIVERIRSESENLYVLDGNKLNGFGTGVPDSVRQALKISYQNFQAQHPRRIEDERYSQMNPLYLLSLSPSEVAKTLNDLAGLEDIDIGKARVNDRVNRESREVEKQKGLKEKYEQDLTLYEELDQLETSVFGLEQIQTSKERATSLIEGMELAILAVRKAKEEKAKFAGLDLLKGSFEELAEIAPTRGYVAGEIAGVRTALAALAKAKADLGLFAGLPLLKKQVEEADEAAIACKVARDGLGLIKKAKENLQIAQADSKLAKTRLASAKAEFESLKPKTCPLCEKEW